MILEEKEKEMFLYNIRALKKAYMANKEFFNTIGIDESLLSLWNNGRRRPHINTIIKICKNLNINIEDIISKKIRIKIVVDFEEDEINDSKRNV